MHIDKKRFAAILLLVLLFGDSFIWAQSTEEAEKTEAETAEEPETVETEGAAAEAETAETEPEEESKAPVERNLLLETLPRDIGTSSFYELGLWLQRLGLSTRGGREELERRLFEYFGLAYAPATTSEGRSTGVREIIIEAAVESGYYTIEEIDEQYVRLRGGVQMRLHDQDRDATHVIIADEMIFNQAENRVTALGNINYTIDREGVTERFIGNQLSFDLDTWEGIFIAGTSIRPREASEDTEEIDFYYSGDYITRSPDDVIVLEDGSVTSSNFEDPYYHIRASKIWVLSPGDWGMQDATLYIGRVPLLYFPYFFNPGDELLFHPSFGFSTREGYFIQTTTYLLGRKLQSDTGISFLQNESNTNAKQEIKGLFLRDTDEQLSEEEQNRDWTLKLLADFYSRLGGYLGLEGSLPNLALFRSLEFQVGLAVSQHIYETSDEFYTTLTLDDDRVGNSWNRSNFVGIDLPFRYFADTIFSLSIADIGLTLNVDLEIYSDPDVAGDFSDRSEDINWLDFLEGNEMTLSEGQSKTSLLWRLTGNASPSVSALSPYLSRISFDNVTLMINWLNRDIPNDELREEARLADDSPERSFFFPNELTYPNIDMTISGSLIDSSRVTSKNTETEETAVEGASEPQQELRPPWDVQDSTSEDASEEGFRLPKLNPDISAIAARQPIGYSLTYSIDPQLTIQGFADDEDWTSPDDVDFTLEYSTLTLNNGGSIDWNVNILERLFVFDGEIDATVRYRTLFDDERLDDEDRDSLETQADQYTTATLEHNLMVSTFPLRSINRLMDSSLTYRIDLLIYEYRFESDLEPEGAFEHNFADLEDEEFVTEHEAGLNLNLFLLEASQSLRLNAVLPPHTPSVNGTLTLITGPLTSSAATTIQKSGDEWEFEPLTVTETLTFHPEATLTERLIVDIEEDRVESSVTTLKLWFFNATFNMLYTEGYEFNPDFVSEGLSNPWVLLDDEALRPTTATAGIDLKHESDLFWKNRMRYTLNGEIDLSMDLQRYTQSSLNISSGFTFHVFQFLDITFRSVVTNDFIYQYIPPLANEVNREPRNLFSDILDGFNLFDIESRRQSFFKLQSINFEILHHLVDWDLSITYSGAPELETMSDGRRQFEWKQEIVFLLTWRPVPEFDRSVRIEDEEVTVDDVE